MQRNRRKKNKKKTIIKKYISILGGTKFIGSSSIKASGSRKSKRSPLYMANSNIVSVAAALSTFQDKKPVRTFLTT